MFGELDPFRGREKREENAHGRAQRKKTPPCRCSLAHLPHHSLFNQNRRLPPRGLLSREVREARFERRPPADGLGACDGKGGVGGGGEREKERDANFLSTALPASISFFTRLPPNSKMVSLTRSLSLSLFNSHPASPQSAPRLRTTARWPRPWQGQQLRGAFTTSSSR